MVTKPTPLRLLMERDVVVQMRDGVGLRADIYRPMEEGRYPVLLERTPYNKSLTVMAIGAMDPVRAVERGYAVVIQDVRGRYRSEGTFYPFVNEVNDGYDTVEWVASQPWADGKTGMFGGSYVGATQWLAAVGGPPHLTAICPMITAADYHEGWTYQGGACAWGFLVSWTLAYLGAEAVVRRHEAGDISLEEIDRYVAAIDGMAEQFGFLPLREFPHLRELAPYFYDWLAHPGADEYWQAIGIAERHGRIGVPALNLGGWYDIFLGGTLRNFSGMQAHGATPEARQGQRLLIGPWNHSIPTSSLVGGHDFGMRSGESLSPLMFDLQEVLLRWYDHWLKGRDNGVAQEAPVRVFVMGENAWRDEWAWPPAGGQLTPYYLHSSRGLAATAEGGTLSRRMPVAEEPDVYVYDPSDPVPTRGGGLCCYPNSMPGGVFDQTEIERRPDVLVFSTPPLDADLEVTGPVTVTLWAASTAPDTDFTAKLVDVDPAGYARNLTDGIIRARYREGTDKPLLIEPGRVYPYQIDLGATSNLFRAGHQIRLEISSSNFPRFDRNPNTGHAFGADADLQTAMQTIYHEQTWPSHVVLPIMERPSAR